MSRKQKSQEVVGEVALYGNREIGFGYLARAKDGRMFGDGKPAQWRGLNDAYWLGVIDIQEAGYRYGRIAVFAPGGQRVGYVDPAKGLPYYGQLDWEAAPVYVISMEEIERVAAEQAAAGVS